MTTSSIETADWFGRRHRVVHMTIRDIDCADFDVAGMIERYRELGVTLFSFFAGGYVTTYPSKLDWQRVPDQLGGRDLCGEIIRGAREAGIVCWPMIDLGEIPVDVAERHPDWPARKADGGLFFKSDYIVTSCPLGGYVRDCSRELVEELVERYGKIDGIKWGGASYGFAPGVCHCETCRRRYPEETGRELPPERDAEYALWQQEKIRETVQYLAEVVHDVAGIPVVGNSVWHLGRGMSLAEMSADQDFTQVEIQTRTHPTGDDGDPSWDRFATPIETTRYVAGLTPYAPWVVASYFLAWPWRWVAVPWPEQKLYLAQVAANGGCPMVNLTTGAPAQHYDQRGFRAIGELFGFMRRNEKIFEGDRSAARVAIVYDHPSAVAAKQAERLNKDYLHDLHGCEDILDRSHVPYDILDSARLEEVDPERYAAILVSSASELGAGPAAALDRLNREGVGIVMTGLPGSEAVRGGIEALLGGKVAGAPRPSLASKSPGPIQAYADVAEHPITDGIESSVLAVATPWVPVQPVEGTATPLTRAEPFRLFPEGLAFPEKAAPGEPLVIANEAEGRGRTVWFPIAAGRVALRTGHPDNERIVANALRWAASGAVGLSCAGAPDLRLSLRETDEALLVHAINTSGRQRYLTEFNPIHHVRIAVTSHFNPSAVILHTQEGDLPLTFETREGSVELEIPEIVDYAIIELVNGEKGVIS